MPKSIITVKAIYKLVYVTLFVFLLTVLLFERSAAQALSQEDISFSSADGVILQGTVIAPQTDHARYPAIVMLSGAGPTTRAELQNEAEAFARHGLVVLIYDKRTIGYSMVERNFSLLADDALNLTETNVKTRLLRARMFLREQLSTYYGEHFVREERK